MSYQNITSELFGHWSGQNRIGVRVLGMIRRPNGGKTGRGTVPATAGKLNKRGLLWGVTHAKIREMIRQRRPMNEQIDGAVNQ